MDIHIAAFRSRIGSFNTSGHIGYIQEYSRKQSYKSRTRSTRTINSFRKLFIYIVLVISIISRIETFPEKEKQDFDQHFKYIGPLATATLPVSFFIIGGQVSVSYFPVNHLSYLDVVGVHSAATLQGVQAVHLDRGWVVTAVPLQYSILSDSNFYARYTYGNRSNRGIKLTHWNAGSAYLDNKTIEIENVISDHHPHLIGK